MESDIRYLVKQGKEFLKNQAYKKAEMIFLRILNTNREYADVYNMLGVIYQQTGEFSQAIEYFKKALKINPRYTEAMLNLSVLYNDLGEYKEAKALVQQSKKLATKNGEGMDPLFKGKLANKHAEVGDMYRGAGLYTHAIVEFQKALELAPHFYDIRNRLGICLRETGKSKEATNEFQKIVKAKPGYGDAQMQLGITWYSMGNKEEARKVWTRLSRDNPKHELARMCLRISGPMVPARKPAKASLLHKRKHRA